MDLQEQGAARSAWGAASDECLYFILVKGGDQFRLTGELRKMVEGLVDVRDFSQSTYHPVLLSAAHAITLSARREGRQWDYTSGRYGA